MLIITLHNLSSFFLFTAKPGYTMGIATMRTVAILGLIVTCVNSIISMNYYKSIVSIINKWEQFKQQLNLVSKNFQTQKQKWSDMLLVCSFMGDTCTICNRSLLSLFPFWSIVLFSARRYYIAPYIGILPWNLLCFTLRAVTAIGGFECIKVLSSVKL